MPDERRFRWLHLSDLHVGMSQEPLLWSSVRSAFFDDLKYLLEKTGPVDVVIFSGDLTQQASAKEYDRLEKVLAEIWGQLDLLGSSAPLLAVPGNHDVARPKKPSPASMLMKRWWEEPDVRATFWDHGSDLRRFVQKAFKPYAAWAHGNQLVHRLPERSEGPLPGDLSTTIRSGDLNVGLVGLNSAWLQLDAGEYEKRLDIDLRQLLGVTNQDPTGWRKEHDVALLITHHPSSWLHPEALETWQSEINPPGRFDAHLFGHMHIPDSESVSRAGSERRTALQAPSIFGLERFGDGKFDRIHGYSIGEIGLTEAGRVRRVWPRILHRHASGNRRFIPDFTFELDGENRFTELYSTSGAPTPQLIEEPLQAVPIEVTPVAAGEADQLESIRYRLNGSPAHAFVRLPEQEACAAALRENRFVWIQAEWGLGGDGFVWSVLLRTGDQKCPVYRFDFSDFVSRDQFFDSIKRATGVTFEKLCALIAKQSRAYILFDNVDTSSSGAANNVSEEAQKIAGVVLDYCPEAAIFVRSRSAPSDHTNTVKLRPLDEADTAAYVRNSALGGRYLSEPENAAKLYRVTDGAPSRLDSALKSLQVVGLDDLIAQDADYSTPTAELANAPDTLVRAIRELQESDDPFITRSFELLRTLTLFPQGEQLDSIRRFDNAYPFFPPHASQLLERGLIDAVPIPQVAPSNLALEVRVLTVPRAVREFVRTEMSADDVRKLDRRALEVYFGKDWQSGDISSPVGHKFDEPLQHGYKIANANALLLRLILRAETEENDEEITSAFRVIGSYFAALMRGNHYRSVVGLAGDLSVYLEDDKHAREAALIKSQFGKSLRMIGDTEKARNILENLDRTLLTRDAKRSALLNLALSYYSLNDPRGQEIAADVIKLGRTEPAALHAQAIIIQATETGAERFAKLRELEDQAKRRKYPILANTIALIRADDEQLNEEDLNSLLAEVISRSKSGRDFYNGVRAIVKICGIITARGDGLTDQQKTNLINAYHFLFNERLSSLFDGCHSALWSEFERGADVENLLRLFRHSSLIWRLGERNDREQTYVRRLARRVKPNSNVAAMLPRETAYFLARAGAVLSDRSSKHAPSRSIARRAQNSTSGHLQRRLPSTPKRK